MWLVTVNWSIESLSFQNGVACCMDCKDVSEKRGVPL